MPKTASWAPTSAGPAIISDRDRDYPDFRGRAAPPGTVLSGAAALDAKVHPKVFAPHLDGGFRIDQRDDRRQQRHRAQPGHFG